MATNSSTSLKGTFSYPLPGDLLVGCLDEIDDWTYHSNKYVAKVDEHFDYKHERQESLQAIKERREKRLQAGSVIQPDRD